MFENHRKNLIQRLHFEWTNGNKKCQKWSILAILASSRQPEACSQTVLPDISVLIGQKLAKNAKI